MNTFAKLSLVLCVALVAFSSVGVALASASEPEFRAESFPVTLKGSGSQKIGTKAGTVTCSSSTQTGEASSQATWWTLKVADTGCVFTGGITVSVAWNSCEIRYYTYSGMYIVCGGTPIVVTNSKIGCVAEIGSQNLSTISYAAAGSGATRTITAFLSITGVEYTQNSKCPGGAGTFSDGTMGGEILIKGFTGKGEQQGIYIE